MTPKRADPPRNEKAKPKFWFSMMLTYLLMPLFLFLSAGDLSWWQGWIYAALLLVIGIGSRVIAEKKHPGLMAERGKFGKDQNVKPWDKVLAPLMAISLTFPLFIVAGLDHRFGWSSPFPVWINMLGLILISLGYIFASWALVENQFFSSMVRLQMDRGHFVCDTGPYRIVRHPGYAGNMLPLGGIVLALNSIWTIIPAIVALIIILIRTVLEDRALQAELPGYKDYAHRVKFHLIPGIF